jgi:hypothetical protein
VHLFEGLPRPAKLRVSRLLDSKGFEEMLGLLRATVETSSQKREESEEEITMGLEALKQTAFKSKENELLVWQAIDGLMTDKLRDYPTSLADDKCLLQTILEPNLSNVITLRRGEKEVLLFYQTMSRRMARLFGGDYRRLDLSPYRPYLESVGMANPIF